MERIGQNLVELDADVTRQMLDASSSLAGQTADRWHDAQGRLSSLWQGQLALADVLERVVDERGSKSSVSAGRARPPHRPARRPIGVRAHAPTPPGR